MVTVLTILPEGFEEIEVVTPVDIWRRAGFEVLTAALSNHRSVLGRNNITIRAETMLSAISASRTFDLLFLPGGPGVAHLRSSPDVQEIVGRHFMADKWIAAICAAPLVLNDAGLLSGRRYTAHPSTSSELSAILGTEKVVEDGKIITSRGAGTATSFALHTIRCLAGAKIADEVSISICA